MPTFSNLSNLEGLASNPPGVEIAGAPLRAWAVAGACGSGLGKSAWRRLESSMASPGGWSRFRPVVLLRWGKNSLPEFMNFKNFSGLDHFSCKRNKFGDFFWAIHSASERASYLPKANRPILNPLRFPGFGILFVVTQKVITFYFPGP